MHAPVREPDALDLDGCADGCGWVTTLPDEPDGPNVARDDELAALRRLLAPGGPRLVTLVGVRGVGKTRLALRVAHELTGPLDARVAWIGLDAVTDLALAVPTLAALYGVQEERGRAMLERLRDAVGERRALVVLDTVEHLVAGASVLARMLEAVPALTILATSRVPLGVGGERTFSVEPLRTPARGVQDPEALLANPAVSLLAARVADVRPEGPATAATAQAYAAIARRLDGIPLAIELAAAALRTLEPHQLADRLEGTVGSLEAIDATLPARRRSLRATMDWTHELLPEALARMVRRLSVLASPFDVSTAAALLAAGEQRGLAPLELEVAEALHALNRAYLLRRVDEAPDGAPRYEMLRTVRADARDRLERTGEHLAMRWAHAYHVLAVAEDAERELPTEREADALARLDRVHDDLGAAIDWAIERGDGEFAVRLTGALAEFWRSRGHLTEGRIRLQTALAWGTSATSARRRKALRGAGILASYQGDYRHARALLTEALALAREAGDDEATAATLNWLGTNAYGAGDLDAAERFIAEALAMRRALGEPGAIAASLNALGGIHHFRGELDRALAVFQESLALKQMLGNPNGIAVAVTNIGLVERDVGHPERAANLFEQALDIWQRTGDRQRGAVGLHNAALVDFDMGRLETAERSLRDVVAIMRELNDRTGIAYALADLSRVLVVSGRLDDAEDAVRSSLRTALSLGAGAVLPLALESAGMLAAARGQRERAVRLWAAADAERRRSGFVNMPADRRLLVRAQEPVAAAVGEERWTAWWQAGAALPAEAAVHEATQA